MHDILKHVHLGPRFYSARKEYS